MVKLSNVEGATGQERLARMLSAKGLRRPAPKVLDAKVTYPNRTLVQCQHTQMITSRVKPQKTAQIVVSETRAIGIFYVEKPLVSRTFCADVRSVGRAASFLRWVSSPQNATLDSCYMLW